MAETTTTPLEKIIELRQQKLDKIRQEGINPYPSKSNATSSIKEITEKYNNIKTGEMTTDSVCIAGRIVSQREMGKASFCDILDFSGKMQFYIKRDIVGEQSFKIFKDLIDIADFVEIKGAPFRTKTGELSIKVESWALLSKSLRPLPEKWHGLKDVETRYRQRYLDLIANPQVKEVFIKRSQIISTVREKLNNLGFMEVETPMMQSIPGGAAARPFATHHNALNIDLYLRIAPELYLKRLVVGNLEKVFEIGRNFRNEGIDRQHNPEFTMMEVYQAYAGYEDMMKLAEDLISACAKTINVDLKTPFRRVKLFDLLKENTGIDFAPILEKKELVDAAKKLKLELTPKTTNKKILENAFDEFCLPKLNEPTFVTDYPTIYSPLAKQRSDAPDIAERFELFIKGKEVANAFSELNDPEEQRKRFNEQMEARKKGDEEAQMFDEDFVIALEHGLPPTGGLGIGIDRLTMVLTDTESIRDVVLFPTLRP
ncbi:MAG: lysine--tRNA ligase [Endomicrobiales bacterium]|nr:lysine--tRNA ligase [Endomicrobiales bacterium]